MEQQESTESTEQQERKFGIKGLLLEALLYVALVLLCVFVVPQYVVQRTIVKGDSMQNTLTERDNLIVNKILFHVTDPKRFDVVVFYPYGKGGEDYYVKRVIGLPGEELRIDGPDIYVDGTLLNEDFGKEPISFAGIAEEPLQLAEDEYFLMGDNRSISLDSRYHQIGPVKRNLIEGKAVLRIWPLNKFGLIN